ncbi:trans-aconitate 2-methyltransferase [Pseudonocardia sp. ICBG1293]|uniref:class I SAM-dependent methyltransferase n=1 Tax=Pseudonocardia sp. ICBG1293 TaxID=2844382 RepID=UPI001CCE96F3|nr:class I SAM-dependent methyltransferase [Pseudonocardia sp. ICBG1293]
MTDHTDLLAGQLTYYRERATEYEDTFAPYMQPALPAALQRLRSSGIGGDVLELASGTGYWTRYLSELAETVTAVDGAPEMIEVAGRLQLPNVSFERADLFDWRPARRHDHVFFAHWLAHVPDERFGPFWAALRGAVRPGGTVQFIDVTGVERRIETFDDEVPDLAVHRTLADGRSFRIVKVFREVADLVAQLRAAGWAADVVEFHPGFVHAVCTPLDPVG